MLNELLERQRTEFEAWWEGETEPTNSMHPCSTIRHEDERDGPVGDYVMFATWGAWEAWKEQWKRANVQSEGPAESRSRSTAMLEGKL